MPNPTICTACRTPMTEMSRGLSLTICSDCLAVIAQASDKAQCRSVLQAIDAPMLMMQSNPRQVFTVNDQALALFSKPLTEAEGQRGGELFNCIHSFTELGCGKDANCDDCKIKAAIVATLEGSDALGVSATLTIRQQADIPHRLMISSENVGDYALVRIEKFEREA